MFSARSQAARRQIKRLDSNSALPKNDWLMMHMTKGRLIVKMKTTFALLLLSAPAVQAAPPNMQPGMWEITTKMEMPGMPMQMPPQTVKRCFKKEDLKESKDALPADKTCKFDDLKESGNTVRWKMSCNGAEGPMTGTGEVTYAGQSYSGTTTMVGKAGGESFKMNQKYSAKRVGDCN